MILTPVQVARYAQAAGFAGPDLVTATAVSFTEDPPHETLAHYAPGTGESSWGLWQINVGGRLWADRVALAATIGIRLTNPTQLTQPNVNAQLARALQRRDGWRIWSTWADRAYLRNMSAATAAVAQLSGSFGLTRYLLQIGTDPKGWQSGHDVALWQGVVGATVDGVFGPQTKRATILWQGRHRDENGHHLAKDGVVGPLTCRAAGWIWEGPQ